MSAMDKVNNILGKLPFVKLAGNIPESIRGKIPFLNVLIPFANHIASGAAIVVLVACFGGGGGGVSGNIRELNEEWFSLDAQRAKLARDDTAGRNEIDAQMAKIIEQLEILWADAGAKGASYSGEHETLNKADQFQYDLTEDGAGVRIEDMLLETEYIPLIVNIPAEIEGYPVVEIDWGEINPARRIISVTLPNSITKLGNNTFFRAHIKEITLPSGLIEIGRQCFYQTDLASIVIPTSITTIPHSAFAFSNLTEITIPGSVITIEDSAFDSCDFTIVAIPEGVTQIGQNAFRQCPKLTTVTIPESVTTIGHGAFASSPELVTVNLPSHPIKYTPFDDNPTRTNSSFLACPKLSLATRKAIQDTGYPDEF